MADNTTITEGVGKVIASDEIAGVNYQRIKLIHGADGTNDGDVSSANPLPTADATVNTTLGSPAQTGEAASATASLALEDGGNLADVATDTGTIAEDTTSIDGKITACNTGAVVLAAGTALVGKVGIDQETANANEVVVKSGTTAVTNAGLTALNGVINSSKVDVNIASGNPTTITATQSTGSNLKVEASNAGTFATQNTDSVVGATFVVKTIDFTASATAQAVWTPAAGKKFVITDIIISTSAAGYLTLFDGTDNTTLRVAKFYLGANAGACKNYRKPYVSATADNVLKYTTGSVVAGSITVSGYEI